MESLMILAKLAGTPGPYRPVADAVRMAVLAKLDLAGNPVARSWVVSEERRRRRREATWTEGPDWRV